MDSLLSTHAIIPFFTLCVLELVLGIDNIIFISILASKLPKAEQQRARITGLGFAVFTRVGLLLSLSWMMSLTSPLLTAFGQQISGRDLILLLGGTFLIGKSTREIHDKMETHDDEASRVKTSAKFAAVIVQIVLVDIVFSLDSVVTAVGMVNELPVMIAAVTTSTFIMMFTAQPISKFVDHHPTIKMLALSFLIMIGFTLIAEGLGQQISKAYIYFAMGFSLAVELLNIRLKNRVKQKA